MHKHTYTKQRGHLVQVRSKDLLRPKASRAKSKQVPWEASRSSDKNLSYEQLNQMKEANGRMKDSEGQITSLFLSYYPLAVNKLGEPFTPASSISSSSSSVCLQAAHSLSVLAASAPPLINMIAFTSLLLPR